MSCKTPAKAGRTNAALLDLQPDTRAFFESLHPSRIRDVAEAEFRRVPIGINTNVFALGFLDLAKLTGAYKASVKTLEPGVYLRSDTWRLSTDVVAGSLIQAAAGQALPINVGLVAGREIIWSRPFDDKMAALRSVPKTPVELPLNSERARALESGEFVSLPVRMGLSLGVARGASTPALAVQASAGVFWSGEFRVNVTRLDGNFVRVKVAPSDLRGRFLTADANAHLDFFGYGPFGLVDLDRQADDALGLDVLRLAMRRVGNGEAMVVDYVIDLSDRHGAMAYDAILRDTLQLKAGALAGQAAHGLGDVPFGDITLAEALHAMDVDQPAERRRVARVFRGSRFFSEDTLSLRLGTKLLRSDEQKSLSRNLVQTVDERGQEKSWVYHVFSAQRRLSSFLSSARRSYGISAAAIIADEPSEKVQSLLFNWDSSERVAKTSDKAAIAWATFAVLGRAYTRLGLNDVMPNAPVDKLEVRLELSFGSEFFDRLTELATANPDEYEKRLWTAVWLITPRFERRQGPRTPAPADSLAGDLRRLMQSSLLAVRNTTRNVLNAQWEGINGTTAKALVAVLGKAGQQQPTELMTALLAILYRDESAQEIAPALLLALTEIDRKDPWIAASVSSGGRKVYERTLGENRDEAFQEFAASAFQRINQTGYDR